MQRPYFRLLALVAAMLSLGSVHAGQPLHGNDSLALARLATTIETWLNENHEPFGHDRTGKMTVHLAFDSLGRFAPVNPGARYPLDSALVARLVDFDRQTGRLSGNPLFKDTTHYYFFSTFHDGFSNRLWFSKLIKQRSDTITERLFVNYEVYAEAPGGWVTFVDSLVSGLRRHKGLEQYLVQDSMVISFVVDTAWAHVAYLIKVNGARDEAIAGIITRQGNWSPAVLCGHPVQTAMEITIWRSLWDAHPATRAWPYLHRRSSVLFFPRIAHAERLRVDRHPPQTDGRERLSVVSILLDETGTALYAPFVLQGDRTQGQRLLERIEANLHDSPIRCFPGPKRVYVSYPEGLL